MPPHRTLLGPQARSWRPWRQGAGGPRPTARKPLLLPRPSGPPSDPRHPAWLLCIPSCLPVPSRTFQNGVCPPHSTAASQSPLTILQSPQRPPDIPPQLRSLLERSIAASQSLLGHPAGASRCLLEHSNSSNPSRTFWNSLTYPSAPKSLCPASPDVPRVDVCAVPTGAHRDAQTALSGSGMMLPLLQPLPGHLGAHGGKGSLAVSPRVP